MRRLKLAGLASALIVGIAATGAALAPAPYVRDSGAAVHCASARGADRDVRSGEDRARGKEKKKISSHLNKHLRWRDCFAPPTHLAARGCRWAGPAGPGAAAARARRTGRRLHRRVNGSCLDLVYGAGSVARVRVEFPFCQPSACSALSQNVGPPTQNRKKTHDCTDLDTDWDR